MPADITDADLHLASRISWRAFEVNTLTLIRNHMKCGDRATIIAPTGDTDTAIALILAEQRELREYNEKHPPKEAPCDAGGE